MRHAPRRWQTRARDGGGLGGVASRGIRQRESKRENEGLAGDVGMGKKSRVGAYRGPTCPLRPISPDRLGGRTVDRPLQARTLWAASALCTLPPLRPPPGRLFSIQIAVAHCRMMRIPIGFSTHSILYAHQILPLHYLHRRQSPDQHHRNHHHHHHHQQQQQGARRRTKSRNRTTSPPPSSTSTPHPTSVTCTAWS